MENSKHIKKVLIAGASGLIGKKLVAELIYAGYAVIRLVRHPVHKAISERQWDPNKNIIHLKDDDEFDIIISLSGANIAKKWTPKYKKELVSSRLNATKVLSETFAKREKKPSLFISASGGNVYGATSEAADESAPAGTGFLEDLVVDWETEANKLSAENIRCVQLRLAAVLDPAGGAIKKMLPAFKFGLGGKLGSGKQMMSWIDLDDALAAILHIIEHKELTGPVNITAPKALSNRDFTICLSNEIGLPALFPVPKFIIKLIFGEMGETILLNDFNIKPTKLSDSGFKWQYPEIEDSFKKMNLSGEIIEDENSEAQS